MQLEQQNVARFFHLPFSLVVNPNIHIIILDSQLLIQGDQNMFETSFQDYRTTV